MSAINNITTFKTRKSKSKKGSLLCEDELSPREEKWLGFQRTIFPQVFPQIHAHVIRENL